MTLKVALPIVHGCTKNVLPGKAEKNAKSQKHRDVILQPFVSDLVA